MRMRVSVVLVFVLFAFPPSTSAQQKRLEPVKIGYSGVGIAHDLLKIMGQKGIFEKYGVNAQGIYIGSGSLMNQAVVAGSIQFTTSDLPSQIQSALAGIEFRIIGVTIDRLDGAIMARKHRNAAGAKGEEDCHQPLWFVSDIVTRMVLRHWGIDPRDVVLMQVGNTPTRIAAILSGQVDGGLINPTDVDRMTATGCCVLLADLSDLDIPYARFGVAGLGSYFKANPETAARVLADSPKAFTTTRRIRRTGSRPSDPGAAISKRPKKSIKRSPILTDRVRTPTSSVFAACSSRFRTRRRRRCGRKT